MKEVYDTRQIAHLWAHKSQRSARNKQGNFSFACADLRSYSTVIATRVERKGETVFLLASHGWSNWLLCFCEPCKAEKKKPPILARSIQTLSPNSLDGTSAPL